MSTITEVGQLGPGLGGEGQQGPEGEKEAASEVFLASASPLAPEFPFALAPLHLHGHSGAHSPSFLAQNPLQSHQDQQGESEGEKSQVGKERWGKMALK